MVRAVVVSLGDGRWRRVCDRVTGVAETRGRVVAAVDMAERGQWAAAAAVWSEVVARRGLSAALTALVAEHIDYAIGDVVRLPDGTLPTVRLPAASRLHALPAAERWAVLVVHGYLSSGGGRAARHPIRRMVGLLEQIPAGLAGRFVALMFAMLATVRRDRVRGYAVADQLLAGNDTESPL